MNFGDDYRAVMDMVNGRDSQISSDDELHEKLMVREHTLNITNSNNAFDLATTNTSQYRPQQN